MSLENLIAARVVAGFLKAGRVLDSASSVLLLGTLVLARGPLSAPVLALMLVNVVLAVAAKYLAWRVALDAEFFTLLHEQPTQTAAFDAALAAFLGRPAPVAGRSLASRCRGARRLVVGQALLVGLQAGGLLLLLALTRL
jgi:hypothetical protein